jgi:hypothetical protein
MLTALFTSSDRQLDTKERRRYELKLSKAPNMRTVIIAVLAFILIGTAVDALAKELRVTTTRDLVACPLGVALINGPDAGQVARPGDTCVVLPNTYNLAADPTYLASDLGLAGAVSVDVIVENLTIRSTNGATATFIIGRNPAGGAINVAVRGVTIGGAAPDQGFTITNLLGAGVCVTDADNNGAPGVDVCDLTAVVAALAIPLIAANPTGISANENITIQNNSIRDSVNEGILFNYDTSTAVDTVRIIKNDISRNGGDGIGVDSTVGAIGRRGRDENFVIAENTFDANVAGSPNAPGVFANLGCTTGFLGACVPSLTFANIHFYNTSSIEQLAILRNTINRAGQLNPALTATADGILIDMGSAGATLVAGDTGPTEVRDTLIDQNMIQFNSANGIKFDYAGRLGENVIISNNKGTTRDQGITHNGPQAMVPFAGVTAGAGKYANEGNGIYVTARLREVRGVQIFNNNINSNKGRYDLSFAAATTGDAPADNRPCRDGNGLGIEVDGRVEELTLNGNDFRQNFNNGVCIANRGDFDRSTVTNNKFHNNGVGDLTQGMFAPYGDGFGVYHDTTITEPETAGAPVYTIDAFRVEDVTFSGNEYRENGQPAGIEIVAGCALPGVGIGACPGAGVAAYQGFGFGLFIRTERADISRLSFESEVASRNYLGGYRLETDSDSPGTRSGDIREISYKNVQANENQGDTTSGVDIVTPPALGVVASDGIGDDVSDNGDGIALVTDNGDIANFSIDPSSASQNGQFGLRLESDGSIKNIATPILVDSVRVEPGDVDRADVKDSTFNFNGTRAAVGRGSGILISGESVRNVTIDPTEASNNNDHGVQVTGSRNVSNILVENSKFNNNDRNRDTIGDGVQVNANEDLSQITIKGVEASSNYGGVRAGAAGRQIAQGITIENVTANNNRKEGIAVFAGRDMIGILVKGCTLLGNGTGIDFTVIERGTNIVGTENKIVGDNGQGIGVLVNGTGVDLNKNDIRNNAVGIEVRKARDNKANNNNIARNEQFGVDASALNPGEVFDATNNWWGEPSGPKHATNPGGIGDRVTDKVNFKPFLGEPAVPTETGFVVESLTASKTDVTVGESVTFSYTIKNNGTEEGTQEVTVVIKDGLGNVVNQSSRQITVNPAGSRQENFSFIFQTPGTYTVTVTAQPSGSTKSVTVSVAGTAACLPFALDNNPRNQKIDDAEIITAIDLWVRGGAVPGCSPPVTISDTQIIQLIDLWVRQSQLTVPLGGKMTSQSATLSVASNFATLGASVRAVRPGESFTVTVSVDAKDGISGLLLSQALPAGWSAKPIQMSGAYFKASENKWLWLNAKGTVSVSYEVTVPATAQPGLYTIAGRVKAAVPGIESELQPLTVEVLGAPVALAVKAITLSQQPVRTSGAYFIVEGVGIAQTTVRVFSMTGKLVFSQTAQGNVVPFSAASELANGVYLYVVTVQGADGQTVTSKIAKLVVLR